MLISIEEGSIGGFAAHVMQFLALDGEYDLQLMQQHPCYHAEG